MLDRDIHESSMLRIPLVAKTITQLAERLNPQGIDREWNYRGIVPTNVTGFSPFGNSVSYARHSRFASMLKAPKNCVRALNERDVLVNEVFFHIHDLFHVWGYEKLENELGSVLSEIRNGKRSPEVFQRFALYHLVTEAVATVAVDYWYLSEIELDDFSNLGSAFSGLTTRYRHAWQSEITRASSNLVVSEPAFFEWLCEGYCRGTFSQVSIDDMRLSPRLLSWLEHEISYGEKQRVYILDWICNFFGLSAGYLRTGFDRVAEEFLHEFQSRLRKLSVDLWDAVKSDQPIEIGKFEIEFRDLRAKPECLDFRFHNVSRDRDWQYLSELKGLNDVQFMYLASQLICTHEYASFDNQILDLIRLAVSSSDTSSLLFCLQHGQRLKPGVLPAPSMFTN